AARYEMAREVEDMLARRCRLLFLDAALAESLAPAVAELLAEETGRRLDIAPFMALARQYRTLPAAD
ncbi:MAG TPA: glycerol-3-phosphate dehydrogenase C-terminal domain-containing protein, partial [Rubrivivax sp.]|nr:glycerol-3-phosphate dehydrogenase C-terminal domain-containing protein [Rubrivivax sp.]